MKKALMLRGKQVKKGTKVRNSLGDVYIVAGYSGDEDYPIALRRPDGFIHTVNENGDYYVEEPSLYDIVEVLV